MAGDDFMNLNPNPHHGAFRGQIGDPSASFPAPAPAGLRRFGPAESWAGRHCWLASCFGGWLALSGLFVPSAMAGQGIPEPIPLTRGWELQDATLVRQTGEAISGVAYRPARWHPATVPGTVLTSLVNDGSYPEPLYGENNRRIPESLCRVPYWYRTQFVAPTSYAGKQVWLTFHGINYLAEVWLNGQRVGEIKGAFIRGIFNVTPYVTLGATNALAVRVLPQPHPGDTHEKTIATGTALNGGITALDGPTFLCSIGWDWIPTIRDRNTGIWQDVTLSATGPVVVQDPFVTSDLPLPRTDTADLTVQATVRNVTSTPQAGRLTGTIEGLAFHQDVSLAPGETRVLKFDPATTPGLRLRKPRLWWPNGYGPQNLYTLRLAFSINGAVSDLRETSFGIRKITYSLPGSDNLALSVNGVPVVAKGGDWGMDEALKRIPRGRLEAQVRMHQLANYTMIRNWVGQSTSAALYDLCDRYGILLWDEFFEPYPGDGPIPEDVPLYLTNVRDKILRFRSHACVALWCARNEGDPPPAVGEGIQKLLAELDPGRLYQPSSTSGRGVNSGGPYHWRTPREFYTYGEAFKTEIGAMSVPTLEAVRAMMPAPDWEVINDDWAEHDFCGGAQQGDRYPFIIASRYGPIANQADFVRKSQLANYEGFRALYEARFAKLFKPATGVLTWMSHPAQPSFVWQLYSHDLEPNASLYGTRKACEPVHIQLNQATWQVQVINNTPARLAGLRARSAVYDLDGNLLHTRTDAVTAAPSAVSDVGPVTEASAGVHFVKVELRDAKGRLVSENFYWRATAEAPDDFQALNRLPSVALNIRATQRVTRGKSLIEVTVSNPTRRVALMAHLQLRKARSGQRVLPVFYSDNYVSLLPGERRSLTLESAVADFAGEAPLLAVDGWNVTVAAGSGGKGVQVVPNAAAQACGTPGVSAVVTTAGGAGLNCGGSQLGFYRFGAPPPEFAQDYAFQGGNAVATNHLTAAIDTQVAHAAPVAVYRSARYGKCTYTIPVTKGTPCTVRLHFAEVDLQAGQRKFNVEINGRRVLTDYDIAAEAGQGKAVVKDFPSVSSDAQGNIVVAFTPGQAGEPKICGIQILR